MTYKLLRSLLVFSSIGLLLLGGTVSYTHTLHAQTERRCFDETGYCINGRIREFWEQNDGLRVFGLPITEQQGQLVEGQLLQVQWFERNRLELHPENPRPYDVQLGLLGVDALQQQGRDWFTFPKSTPQSGCRFFEQTGHNICGAMLERWRASGIELDGVTGKNEEENVALFGLPLSDVQTETIEGQTLQVQWFERARFELHPENAPPYNVLLGLLGSELQPLAARTDTGRIVFVSDRDGNQEVYVVNADGLGLINLSNHPAEDYAPQWSPDGTQVAFISERNGDGDLYVVQANGQGLRQLANNVWDYSWSPDSSKIAFDHTSAFYIVNMDGSGIQEISINGESVNDFVWSPDGSRIFYDCLTPQGSGNDFCVVNADGSGWDNLTDDGTGLDGWFNISPDGTRIAFTSRRNGSKDEIYIMNADGTGRTRLTHDATGGDNKAPVWSPDGTLIAFRTSLDRNVLGNWEIYVIAPDGSGLTNVTQQSPSWEGNPIWSPDSQRIAFTSNRDGNREIYITSKDGTGLTNITRHPGEDGGITWSPDSTRIAFVSDRSGDEEIYIMNIDGSGLTNITNHPGDETGYSWIPVLADLCPDTPDPVSAQVRPGKCVTQGEVLIIDIYGFQPREAITVTVSAPDGQSNSTDSVVGPDGTLNNLGYPTETMVPGLWTVEFTGLASGHTATVYFRVSVP